MITEIKQQITPPLVGSVFLAWAGLSLAACGESREGKPGAVDPVDPGDDIAEAHDPAVHGSGQARGGRRHENREFTPELKAYHDVMIWLWHAAPGEKWIEDTCTQSGELVERARTLAEASTPQRVPAADADEWQNHTRALVAANEELEAACQGDRSRIHAELRDVHAAFYKLIKLLPSER